MRISLPILIYHKIGWAPEGEPHPDSYVRPLRFIRQMTVLKKLGYQTISPADLYEAVQGKAHSLPARPILITFDDGSRTVISEAFPIMKRIGYVGTVFVVASAIGQSAFWDGEKQSSRHRLLKRSEIRELLAAGWSLGSHTQTHTRLGGLSRDRLLHELADSKRYLETEFGIDISWLAYPYGDFDEVTKGAAMAVGYKLAFAAERGDGAATAIRRRVISGQNNLIRFVYRFYQAKRMQIRPTVYAASTAFASARFKIRAAIPDRIRKCSTQSLRSTFPICRLSST